MANYTKADVLRYLKKRCSNKEAIDIKEYLSYHPELLDELLTWEDWESVRDENLVDIDETNSTQIWQGINNRIRRRIIWKRAVAASVVLVMIIIGWNVSRPIYSKSDDDIIVRNDLDYIKRILLNDSSIVELYPHSRIKIDHKYNISDRYITVWGKGAFKVAKNKEKPFVVVSGILKTRALGTYFQIDDGYSDQNTINVRLFEGKIKIYNNKDSVFLSGNDSVVFNKVTNKFIEKGVYSLSTVNRTESISAKEKKVVSSTNIWYQFNNQSLSTVFDRLELLYDVKIEFENSDKDSIYFIGQFRKTDKLSDILQTITVLHNLKLMKIDDHNYKIVRN